MPADNLQILYQQALGFSGFYEEHKGNFAQARQLADRLVNGSRQAGDPSAVADALLTRGFVHLLQGEIRRASSCFGEVERLVPHDANRCLLALSYSILATYEQFNTYPDRNGVGAIEVTARWQVVEELAPLDTRWRDLMQRANDGSAQFFGWLCYSFLCNLQPARYTLEGSRSKPPGLSREQLLQAFSHYPTQLRAMAQANNLPAFAAFSDLAVADLHRRAGDLTEADRFLDRARQTYEGAGDAAGVAVCSMTRGDWHCAPFSTPIDWNLALVDSSSEGSNLAVSIEAVEFSGGTAASYDEAVRLFEQASAPRGLAAVNLRYGYLEMLKDDYAAAARYALQARDGSASCEDWRGYWLAQTHLAMCQLAGARLPDVDVQLLAHQIGVWGNEQGCFSFTLGLGILLNRFARHWLIRRGDYERSLAASGAAQELFEALGAKVNAAQCLVDQGVANQAAGERVAAANYYEQALDRYSREVDSHPSISDNLRQRAITLTANLYQLYLEQMDADGMERSAARLEDQIARLPGGDDLNSLLPLLSEQLAESSASSEQVYAAIEFWSLRQLAKSNIEQARVLVPLYRSRRAKNDGDGVSARSLLDRAASALQSVAGDERHVLEAAVLAERKDYVRAAQSYQQHLEHGGANAGFIGQLTNVMAQFGGAQGQAEVRLQQRRTHEQAFTTFVMVKAYREAQIHLQELERLDGPGWWASDGRPWQHLCGIAEMYEGLNDLELALAHYEQAITQLEARRSQLSRDELKTALASEKSAQYLYFLASRAAMKNGEGARSFDHAERGKARALLDLMAGTKLGAFRAENESMRRWRQLNAQLSLRRGLMARARAQNQPNAPGAPAIASFAQQIADDEMQLRRVEMELAKSNPDFHQAINPQAKTLSLDEVQRSLPPQTALLEYFFLGDDLLAWAITSEEAQTHHLALEAAALVRQIRAFHRACEERRSLESLAQPLVAAFLEPFAEIIRTCAHLIVVPHGAAHILPFQALPFVGGEPLATTHAISYLPSASVLQFLKVGEPGPLPERILAVGNPTKDLTEAATEATYVASLFGQSALVGDEATELEVLKRIAHSALLHFATHGKLSEEAPLNSSILLADGEELTVYELMGLDLKADLVVLSACNTGQGETTGGDDVLGLTRGLLAAGARAAVVSLWPVDDVSTSLLMGEFYRRLRAGDMPRLALKAAQKYLRDLTPKEIEKEVAGVKAVSERHLGQRNIEPRRHDYRHPYYWAPFILVG
jgi:CHAT domain-containing protein